MFLNNKKLFKLLIIINCMDEIEYKSGAELMRGAEKTTVAQDVRRELDEEGLRRAMSSD